MKNESTICHAMQTLMKEQEILARKDMDYQFIHTKPESDTIPFMLLTDNQKPFTAICNGIKTPFFRLEKIDPTSCCALLTLLIAVDMDGYPVVSCEKIYSLRKMKCCIIVNLNCFCSINPLSPTLVNKRLPIIEPKC